MNRLCITSAAALALMLSACGEAPPSPVNPLDAPPVASQVTGDLLDGYTEPSLHLVKFDEAFPVDLSGLVEGLGGEVVFTHAATGIAILSGLTEQSASALAGMDGVARVAMDAAFNLGTGDAEIEDAGIPASPSDPTAATRFARQWNMRAIGADAAWAAGRTGDAGVTIAILDTGIDYTYPDLAGRVDLSRSVSFVPFDDFLVSIFFPGAHPVSDLHYHGTHVASTASSNSNIIAGVTTGTTLMGVKVCNVYGSCPMTSIIQGILWAADNGADVANMSLGGGFDKAGSEGFVGFLESVFNYANSVGMTIVVAAGNAAANLDQNKDIYASYCNTAATVCVSATGPEAAQTVNGPWTNVDAPAPYSNYGRSGIDVAAPGGTGAGRVWAGCSRFSLQLSVCQTGIFILGITGTSMASPHVTGLASLLVEDLGRNPGRIKTALQRSADDLGDRGVDPYYGKGRINVASALGLN